jgi:uncharacterized protein YdhG (YjbR/CyaY superfamily)
MAATADEYLKILDPVGRKNIEKIINEARKIEPKLELGMGYGVLALRLKKKAIIYFAAFKSHVGIYPGAKTIEHFALELEEYETAKGTIRFPFEKPLPYPLIKKIVKYNLL